MRALISLVIVLIFFQCDTSENIEKPFKQAFIRMYGVFADHEGIAMAVSDNNEIFLLGQRVPRESHEQAYVVKTDAEGNQIWEIVLGADTDYFAKDIVVDQQGRICVALEFLADATTRDIRLIRLQDIGTQVSKLDSVSVGKVGENDFVNRISTIADGSYILTGSESPNFIDASNFDVNQIKIASWRFDSNLIPFTQAEWNFNVAGFSNYSEVVGIFEGSNRPFYAFGSTNTVNLTGVNNQNPVTSNIYSGSVDTFGDVGAPIGRGSISDQNFLVAVKEIPGNRYLALGTNNNPSTGDINRLVVPGDMYFALIKEEANNPFLSFENPKALNLGTRLIPKDIAYAGNENVLVCADESDEIRGLNIKVYKLNIAGNVLWERSIDTNGDYSAAKIHELTDGKILLLGTAGLVNNKKMMLIKLNQNGDFLP